MDKTQLVVRQPGEGPSVAVVGDVYRFLVEGQHTGGRFMLMHALIPPGGGPPPHIHHRECEGFYVLRGEVSFYTEGQVVKGGPGTFIHLPEDKPHRFANETIESAEMLIITAPSGIENMFKEVGKPSTVPLPVEPEEIGRLLEVAPRYGLEILPPPGH